MRQRGLCPSQRGQSRHHIWEIYYVLQLLYRHTSGLIDNKRHPYASFVKHSLASVKACSAVEFLKRCLHGGAVVRGEYHQSVLAEPHAVEAVNEPSDGRIHVGYERGVTFCVHAPVAAVVVPRGVVNYVRLVRCIVSQVEKERTLLVALDERQRVVGRYVRVVAHMGVVSIGFNMDKAVAMEPVVRVIVRRVRLDRTYGPSIKFMKAAVVGC